MTDPPPAAVIVLAAGFGKRMRSTVPKVLHPLGGRTLLGHVLAATEPLNAAATLVVVGHGAAQVTEHLAAIAPDARPVVQERQLGTGHAVATALAAHPDLDGTLLVLPGDAPLLTAGTLQALLREHAGSGAATTLLTADLADPTGYGRVLRAAGGAVSAVVEEADADASVRAITEVATSVYCFDAARLRAALTRLTTDNAQGEQYLTDVVALQVADGVPVAACRAADAAETLGVNDRVQLAAAGRTLRDRRLTELMRDGVTVVDPATTWVDAEVRVAADAVLYPNTQLHGRTTVAAGAHVGPNCTLADTAVGAAARVVNTWAEGAEIGPQASVGPWTYLRPGTRLGSGTKAGAFVEMKAAVVGDGSKVPHLSYVGDAEIGARSNIGCGTVFVNYDGVAKHRTTVGDDVRVGSDTMLVAPVRLGDGAYTAAGSVVTDDVPPGALAVARARQRNVDGWVQRRRPGTPAAEAAQRAAASGPPGDDAPGRGEETR